MKTTGEIFTENLNYYFDLVEHPQWHFAEYVGVVQPTVQDWLKGNKYPRMNKMDAICDYLHVNPSDLFSQGKNTAVIKYSPLISSYESLDESDQKLVMDFIKLLAKRKKDKT